MSKSSQAAFQFSTPEIEVERAVSELRYGRPVLLNEGKRRLATLALDSVAPSVYDQFRRRDRRPPFPSADGAARIAARPSDDRRLLAPLSGVSFDQASRLAYALGADGPRSWQPADMLASGSQNSPAWHCCCPQWSWRM